MPRRILRTLLKPMEEFLQLESSSGILLAVCTVLAMIFANSPLRTAYEGLLHANLWGLSLHHWINDGLMTIFFFVVGMEIKREMVKGELSTPQQAVLPIAAAVGGMVVPALIYVFFNPSGSDSRGWGIPMATDIAFALGVLSFFRVPFALRIFLLALAIVDDLGAVLVIAIFYTQEIAGPALGSAVALLAAMMLFRRMGVHLYAVYVVLGIAAWYAVMKSGIHATVAGVLIGFLTPLSYKARTGGVFHPLTDLVHRLHPWVSYAIMPLFALANAGVPLEGVDFAAVISHPIHQGVALGLFFGKPVGIFFAAAVMVVLGMAKLPRDVSWIQLFAVGCLGGIGFTMALFISSLALSGGQEIYSKTGILLGSLASTILGGFILAAIRNRPAKA